LTAPHQCAPQCEYAFTISVELGRLGGIAPSVPGDTRAVIYGQNPDYRWARSQDIVAL
jgi:hypothetical protein